MMTAMLLQQTIALNNEGVHLFLSGDHLHASNVIHQAFTTMKDAASCPNNNEMRRRVTYSTPESKSDSHSSIVEELPLRPQFGKETDTLFAHFRPLPIPQHLLLSHGDDDLEGLLDIVLSYLAFNLAVACHRAGASSRSEAMWKRARDLYCIVLRTQHGLLAWGNNHHNNIQGSLLQCLALNNLAHIHYEFFEYECSQQCLAFMMDIHDSTECLCMNDDSKTILSEWELEEITLNVIYAQSPTMAASA